MEYISHCPLLCPLIFPSAGQVFLATCVMVPLLYLHFLFSATLDIGFTAQSIGGKEKHDWPQAQTLLCAYWTLLFPLTYPQPGILSTRNPMWRRLLTPSHKIRAYLGLSISQAEDEFLFFA